MPRLVQVTAELAQIPEDATKARDLDSSDRDPKELMPKARDPNFGDHDPEGITTKSRNPDFIYYRHHEHEGVRVLAVICLFITAIIVRKIIEIVRLRSLLLSTSEAPIISLISDSSYSDHETPNH